MYCIVAIQPFGCNTTINFISFHNICLLRTTLQFNVFSLGITVMKLAEAVL